MTFEYFVGGLISITVIMAIMMSVAKRRQSKKIRATFLEAHSNATGEIVKSIRETVTQPLVWRGLSSGQYVLLSGSDLLAKLYLDSNGEWIGAVTKEGSWIADPKGLISLNELAVSAQNDCPVARWNLDTWHGRHALDFANGRTFKWKRTGPHSDLTWTWLGGFWLKATTWVLADEQNRQVVWFKNYAVGVEASAQPLPELPLLVLLGSSMMISIMEYSDVGA